MGNIVFEYPYLFLLLALFVICEKFCKAKRQRLILPNMPMLKKVAQKQSVLINALKILMVALLVTALASPIKEDEVVVQNDKGYEISLLLDASGSMEQYDKFGIVKNIVLDFLNKREHDKLGLTIFADFAYVAIPLTYDKKSISELLQKIDVGIAGKQRTALYEALFMSSKLFKDSTAKHKIAILLTDGIDNAGTIPLDVAIKTAKKYGIKVYVIGVGGRGDFEPEILEEIAKETGGKFYQASTGERIKAIYDEIDTLEKSEIKANKYVKKHYFYQYPLGAAIALMFLYIFVRRRRYAV
ncbi:MAG: VWA domain-containing protein [Helicobacteraceae bacterium]|nr:VWA domain-containing protein [Helicobacteraceae bacterium]